MFWTSLIFGAWITQVQIFARNYDNIDDLLSYDVETLSIDSLHLTLSKIVLLDIQPLSRQSLKGYLGWLPKLSNMTYTRCSNDDSPSDSMCLKYGKTMQVMVTQDTSDTCEQETETCHSVKCHRIEWTNHIGGAMDCFVLGEDDWFGGNQMVYQRWPLEGGSVTWSPAVTGDPLHHPSGNVVENLWITSSGFAIYVDPHVPLFVSFNESGSNHLCFSTSCKKHPYKTERTQRPGLSYTVCSANSVKEAYEYSLHRWIEKPEDVPDEDMFKYPVWSTWARYKRKIDEATILKFAHEIQSAGFSGSHLEIDDKWEDCYGNLKFDMEKFPNPQAMVEALRDKDLDITLWVHPFCNKECDCFAVGNQNDFWVKDAKGEAQMVEWWNGESAAVLDTTNEKAVEWYEQRLRTLMAEFDIASFKFDAGEVLWLKKDFTFHDPSANLQPNLYSKAYAELAARFGDKVEVRVGFQSQSLPIFIRMYDKYSRWDYVNGLRTLIPTALQLSLMGYFYILPDMVGGNNYVSLNGSIPDRELFVRWLQASVFLPGIQFSIAPWDYDEEVVAISKKMMDIREKYYSHFLDAAKQSIRKGVPMVRPLWWIAPDDENAMRTDSEFLLGHDILVAPVLKKGAVKRDIYLPEGKWSDVQKGQTLEGPIWMFDYKAPLDVLPYFIRHK